jgi:hypothetical protein
VAAIDKWVPEFDGVSAWIDIEVGMEVNTRKACAPQHRTLDLAHQNSSWN